MCGQTDSIVIANNEPEKILVLIHLDCGAENAVSILPMIRHTVNNTPRLVVPFPDHILHAHSAKSSLGMRLPEGGYIYRYFRRKAGINKTDTLFLKTVVAYQRVCGTL